MKESIIDAKHIIWDHIVKESKKLKDYLIMIEDERALTTSFLANVITIQEGMGDKYLQVHNAINYLNSNSKTQLHFVGIQDRANIIAQVRKYIIKDNMVKEVTTKANFFLGRDEDFKVMFKDIFSQGWPNCRDKQGVCIIENDYHLKLFEKRNGTSAIDKLDLNIKGQHIFEILDRDFFFFHESRQVIFGLPPPPYNIYSELDVFRREMLVASFPSKSIWQRISMFTSKWNIPESPSTTTTNLQDNRI